MNKFENEIVTVEENERCINYYNFRGELVCQLNKNVAESLKDYHQRLYKVKCESSGDMIRSLAKGLIETANNIEKEV